MKVTRTWGVGPAGSLRLQHEVEIEGKTLVATLDESASARQLGGSMPADECERRLQRYVLAEIAAQLYPRNTR